MAYMNGMAFVPGSVLRSNELNGLAGRGSMMQRAKIASGMEPRPSVAIAPPPLSYSGPINKLQLSTMIAAQRAGTVPSPAPTFTPAPIRASTGRRAPRLPAITFKRAPRLTGRARFNPMRGIYDRPGYRMGQRMSEMPHDPQRLGWFQAVANIIGAGAQVYASKEGTKAANVQAGIQREATAGAITLEQERRKTLELEAQYAAQKSSSSVVGKLGLPLVLAGAGVATLLIFRRTSKRK